MRLDKREDTTAHTTGGRPRVRATAGAAHAFRLHARCLVVLFAATACLAPLAPVRAQHPAQPGASTQGAAQTRTADDASLRPFHLTMSDEALVDLRRRIAATRWPERETVDDSSQGVQLAKLQELVRYWGTDDDWQKAEATLNALPQFVRTIDGLDIHFIHVRSRHPNALPLIMTHGWPGSVFELLKTIGPLTDPTAHGGRAEDAFDLVLPSMPGYGFSEKPKGTGWIPDRIARAWDVLMTRLGSTRYVAQGGDWGAIIADVMGRQAPPGLPGIHVNRQDRAATIPPDVAKALSHGEPAPAGLTAEERVVFEHIKDFSKQGTGYAARSIYSSL